MQISGYKIIQNTSGFCFGTDGVLLANFAKAAKGERVLDVGTGTGIIPILMCAKTQAEHFTAIDIQPQSVEMAKRSVALNNLQDRITVELIDIKKAAEYFGTAAFDVITANPPYLNSGEPSPNEALSIARHEVFCCLEDVISASAKLLKYGGRFYMVHRPHRMADVFYLLRKYKLEPKVFRPVYPAIGKKAALFLVEAVLHGGAWMDILPAIYTNELENTF